MVPKKFLFYDKKSRSLEKAVPGVWFHGAWEFCFKKSRSLPPTMLHTMKKNTELVTIVDFSQNWLELKKKNLCTCIRMIMMLMQDKVIIIK